MDFFSKANLHELLNELLVESKESEDDAVITENLNGNSDSTPLANSTSSSISLGDIRKLISTSAKVKSTPSLNKRLPLSLKQASMARLVASLESVSSIDFRKQVYLLKIT